MRKFRAGPFQRYYPLIYPLPLMWFYPPTQSRFQNFTSSLAFLNIFETGPGEKTLIVQLGPKTPNLEIGNENCEIWEKSFMGPLESPVSQHYENAICLHVWILFGSHTTSRSCLFWLRHHMCFKVFGMYLPKMEVLRDTIVSFVAIATELVRANKLDEILKTMLGSQWICFNYLLNDHKTCQV